MSKGISYLVLPFFLLCSGLQSHAQELPLQTWFDHSQTGSNHEITAHFLSGMDEITLMNYELSVLSNGVITYAPIKGEFLAVPQLPTLLASTNFELPFGQAGKAIIKIFLEDKLIHANELFIKNTLQTQVNGIATADRKVELQPESPAPAEMLQSKISKDKMPATVLKTKVDKVSSPYFEDAEIGGLIIDESRSKMGRDFYEQFFNKWIAPDGVGDSFIIKIKELPSFGRVSRVSVLVDNQVLMTRSLSPNFGQLESNVNASIRGVRRYLANRQQMGKDMENEDQQGSGIF